MSGAATVVDAVPDYTTQLHVFHYPTHSAVWTVTMRNLVLCAPTGEHVHSRDGRSVYVTCSLHLTRVSAEASVADMVTEHARFPDVLGTVEVLRHGGDTPHAAGSETASD